MQFPTKLTVEFSQKENGMVSALICEYPKRDDALFEAIRERLQRELNIEPRMVLDGPYVLWRDEVGRRTVALTVDESKEHIQLIVVSILR